MTIGAIVLNIVITIGVIILGLIIADYFYREDELAICITSLLVAILIIAGIWGISVWYYGNTEGGKRALKSQESNLSGGITREVKVYDVEGDVIATYKGRFDIEYDNDRVLFDDEKGNRHIIYYPTGNVIIDEVGE